MKDIVVQKVNKAYGKVQALQDISLHIGEGELFGLIGPDGGGQDVVVQDTDYPAAGG